MAERMRIYTCCCVMFVLAPVRVRTRHWERFMMAQKRKEPMKITDFLTATSAGGAACNAEVGVGPTPPKRTKHRDSYNRKWGKEFPWLRYIPADHDDGPSMLCTLCQKHNETSKRMV